MDGYKIVQFGMGIIIILMMIILLATLIELPTQKVMGYRTTNCYDKYSNEIEGLVCEEEVKCGFISRIISKSYCYNKINMVKE